MGGFNTVFNWAVFSTLVSILGQDLYLVSLWLMYLVGSVVGFTLHRKIVFRVSGNLWKDVLRYQAVNIGPFVVNVFFLAAIIHFAGVNPILGQAIFVAINTVWSYLGHRYFSFRR